MAHHSFSSRLTKLVVIGITVLCLGFGSGVPQAKAVFGAGDLVTVTADLPRAIDNYRGSIWSNLTNAAVGALFNALQLFLGQLAYDAANYIASGGNGQSAMFYQKGFLGYMKDVGGAAVGDFVGSLSDSAFFEGLGVNLCKPSNPALMLRLQVSLGRLGQEAFPSLPNVGVQEQFQRPRPRCQLQEIAQNYEGLYETMSNVDVLQTVASNFDATSNELGTMTSIYNRFLDNVQQSLTTAAQDRQEGQGFNSVQGLISGSIRTPASVINQATSDFLVKQPAANQSQLVGAILNNAWNVGAPQLLWYTASIFTNTLISKLMKNVFEKGLFTARGLRITVTGPATIDSVQIYGKTDARNANIDLKNISFFKQVTFDALAALQACPDDDAARDLWNCSIDQGLYAAMSAKGEVGSVSIQRALDKGYLHGDWTLIPDTETRLNTDKTCYSTGYCSGNIRKLRVLRILPVGFEFAANSQTNIDRCRDQKCITLKEVVAAFNDCNVQGLLDDQHPWCHLIDPNWVITSLPQQCNLSGYGDSLLSPKVGVRREECQDVQTCLKRNDKGECVGGYGYCVAERTAYRFQGDECPARFASCRSYGTRTGTNVNYLRYSIDRAFCSADNVGCLWYASQRIPTVGRDDDWLATTTTGPRVYFNKNVQTCPAGSEGCTSLYAMSFGAPALNLVANGSFERFSGEGNLIGWQNLFTPTTPAVIPQARYTTSTSFTGQASFDLQGRREDGLSQRISIVGGRTYTISFLGRVSSRAAGVANANVSFVPYRKDPSGAEVRFDTVTLNRYYITQGTCQVLGTGYTFTTPGRTFLDDSSFTNDWRRFECSFLAPEGAQTGELILRPANVLIDAVQVEEGEFATDFVDGVNQQLPLVHMKVAPEEFACSGNAATDHMACSKFASVCKQEESGCQGYTDVAGGASSGEIPAILSSNDTCPAQCVGYAEYRKSASAFDLVRSTDDRFNDPSDATSTNFIPSTAIQCTQADVGCQAFTVAEGTLTGQVVNYNYLRTCEKPDENSQTYFTWEGADTTGYQLRTWSLKRDPRTSGPKILAKLEPDQLSFKEPETCTDSLWRSGFDPDCRQFYDAGGRVYYRYFSQTVISTNECTSLRLNASSASDCQKTGGQFTGGNECVYQASLPDSRVCRAQAVSCRRYLGTGAGNVQTVLSQNFRESRGSFAGATSTEALLVGDFSLRVPSLNGTVMTAQTVTTTDASLYTVTFWAKSPATTTVLALKAQDPIDVPSHPTFNNVGSVGAVRVGPEWQRYTIGPFSGAAGADATALAWVFGAPAANPLFIDEITISRIQDVVYVNQNSWNTPDICNKSSDGTDQPGAMLGCRTYRDRSGHTTNAHSFTRLCREQAIGCRAFVDTRNSAPTGEVSVTLKDVTPVPGYPDTSTTTRPADRYVYLIDTPDKRCQAEDDSCRAFGRPNFTPDRTGFDLTNPFTTVYLKDTIQNYSSMLCKPSELFCEEFTYANGLKDYFRDPQKHQCGYREGVRLEEGNPYNVPAGNYNGWFQSSSDIPCYPDILIDGNTFGLSSSGDGSALYRGWVGTCPVEQAECTEFRDPNDHSDPTHPSGRPYFMIRNDKIDTASCAGTVSQADGCILFRDMADTQTRYSTQASYQKYKNNNFGAVTPVDCRQGAGSELCEDDENDANLIMKVKIDRDCAQWLGCKSSETVYDAGVGKYRDICTNMALCDASSNKPGDLFCSHYVDRSSTSTEAIFVQGSYLDSKHYSSRAIGLGKLDYSGFTLPNAFQISDLGMEKVGADGALATPDHGYRFANDYRLAAMIHMPPVVRVGTAYQHLVPPGPNDARILDGTPLASRYPELHLCQQLSTGRIGYYRVADRDSGRDFNCYLAVAGALQGSTSTDALSFTNLQQSFSTTDPDQEAILTRAFPPSECRSQPEEDSPFPASYVTDWDLSKNPPRPKNVLQGYARANFCEYGEDCSCTYKRADYGDVGGASKFFEVYSDAVPPGICQGGPRAGQSCIPTTIFHPPSGDVGTSPADRAAGGGAGDTAQARAIEGSNAAQTCGPPEGGGKCVAFSNVSIVRGNFGACLERDTTRMIAGDRSKQPCLTWNPNPILFGINDPYHFVPTSGYLPPQNSGQYYCLSPVRAPKDTSLGASSFAAFPGAMRKMDYDDEYTSDGSGAATTGNKPGASLSGNLPEGTDIGAQCEDTDDDQDDDGHATDPLGLRLVNTGGGRDAAYAETFFPIKPEAMATWLYGTTSTHDLTADDIARSLYERNFAYFNASPIINPNGNGRIGCGYNQDWVDNIGAVDYDEADQVAQADKLWQSNFRDSYNPTITRGNNEQLMSETGAGTHAAVAPCVITPGNGFTEGDNCFVKTWETQYRVPAGAGQTAESSGLNLPYFNGLISSGHRTEKTLTTLQQTPDFKRCSADKPYFGIRAVFQAKVGAGVDPTRVTRVSDIRTAWSFAGFWVAACAGKSNQVHYIYMKIDVASGDICREIGEVVSRDSHQDAAFTDRVSKASTFSIPGLGIQYNDRYAPFSSALNVKPAGRDPLFQTGQEITGYSALNPPSFIAGGLRTYSDSEQYPKNKWAYLSNIFARIYRVYRFEENAVRRTDVACLQGPFKGRLVDARDTASGPMNNCAADSQGVFRSSICSSNGRCDTNLYDTSLAEDSGSGGGSTYQCNSLSGVNTGLTCLGTTSEICHEGPLQPTEDGATIRNLPCLTRPGWTYDPVRQRWAGTGWDRGTIRNGSWSTRSWTDLTRQQAAEVGAFGCPSTPNSLRAHGIYDDLAWDGARPLESSAFCTNPTDLDPARITGSIECPERVLSGVQVNSGGASMLAQCVDDRGTRVTDGQPGTCQISIPRYSITARNGGNFVLEAMEVGLDDVRRPACHVDADCSFTKYNYYHIPALTDGVSGIYFDSFRSVRSIGFLSYFGTLDALSLPPSGPESYRNTIAGMLTNIACAPGSSTGFGAGDDARPCQRRAGANRGWNPNTFGNSGVINPAAYEYAVTIGDTGELSRGPGAAIVPDSESDLVTRIFDQAHRTLMPGSPGYDDFYSRVTRARSEGRDIPFTESTTTHLATYQIGACIRPAAGLRSRTGGTLGRCVGGTRDGLVCDNRAADLSAMSCVTVASSDDTQNVCGPVESGGIPVSQCRTANGLATPTAPDVALDADNNICTHNEGYTPRLDLCPDPTDEFCGLIAYNRKKPDRSLSPIANVLLPTDVTQGLHTPPFLGLAPSRTLPPDSAYSYIAPYAPNPPRIAAPNTGLCSAPGQCQVNSLDSFALNGQAQGQISVVDSQYKANIRFYAWASHEQMPLRGVYVDWGDGSLQQLPDARMKNHKPYCNVKKECTAAPGLTCSKDTDCPPGGGTCQPIGVCSLNPSKTCHADSECGSTGGRCDTRNLFGNTAEACEENYFDFAHLYTCLGPGRLPLCTGVPGAGTAQAPADVPAGRCYFGGSWDSLIDTSAGRPSCTALSSCVTYLTSNNILPSGITPSEATRQATLAGVVCAGVVSTEDAVTTRCSRDPSRLCRVDGDCAAGDSCVAGLAPPGGCWDPQASSCRFTPRVMVKDNWGWCTGECRAQSVAGTLQDATCAPTDAICLSIPAAKHVNGGCYSGAVQSSDQTVISNIPSDRRFVDECSINGSSSSSNRPWIVYPGAVMLRGVSPSARRSISDLLLTTPLIDLSRVIR